MKLCNHLQKVSFRDSSSYSHSEKLLGGKEELKRKEGRKDRQVKEGRKKTKMRERRIQFVLRMFYSFSQQLVRHSLVQPFKAAYRFDWLELQYRLEQYCLAASALVFHVAGQLRKYCISRILSS